MDRADCICILMCLYICVTITFFKKKIIGGGSDIILF